MILSLINDGNTTLNVRSERTRQGRIPCKSNLFWENNIAKSALSFIIYANTDKHDYGFLFHYDNYY
jgi:hypothetical protein